MLLDVAGDSDALAKARVPAPLPERSKSGDVNQRVNATHTECSSCPGSSVLVSAVAARPLSGYSVEEELKIQGTTLISTVKELSDDPLVQMSMLRAMQNQQVSPEMLRKNMEQRELTRAASTRRHRQSKRQKAMEQAAAKHITQQLEGVQGTSTEVAPQSVNESRTDDPNPPGEATIQSNPAVKSPQEHLSCPSSAVTTSSHVSQPLNSVPPSHSLEVPQPIALNAAQRAFVIQQSILVALQPKLPSPHLSPQQQFLLALLNEACRRQANGSANVFSVLGTTLQNPLPLQQQVGGTQQQAADRIAKSSEKEMIRDGINAPCIIEPHSAPIISNEISSLSRKHLPHGTHSNSSESFDQQPMQCVRIPCRARRMPPDHNFKTAYFLVPKGTTHLVNGQDLVCSHRSCCASGVKFRYCKVCNIPVSKRAFWQKHRHEVKDETGQCRPRDVVDRPPSSSSSLSGTHHTDDSPPIPRSIICVTASTTVTTTGTARKSLHQASHRPHPSGATPHFHSGLSEIVHGTSATACSTSTNSDRSPRVALTVVTADETKDAKNKRQGTDGPDDRHLCHKTKRSKPACGSRLPSRRDDDPTSEGMMAISTTPTDHYPKDSPRRRMELWSRLLTQRPVHPKNNEEAMSRWLMNVLAVSDVTTPLHANDGFPYDDDSRFAIS